MPTYIAMLRGINVLGRKIVKMDRLRSSFESLGFRHVTTYVASGNVVFQAAKQSPARLSAKIGEKIRREFGFSVSIVLKTPQELEKIVRNNPFPKNKQIDVSKLHVTFLSERPATNTHKTLESIAAGPDRFHGADHAVYLYCPDGYGRTKFGNNTLEKKLAVGATTRNWKTVTTLLKMASESGVTR
ncbi:MAG TPA: DUF1697 domain-containing protein [Candidatus Eremiobacteraceae bacterium]|nr:DUF1697 domain-containing protein [Candidatus Eremiobacteraceae bacterium]